MYNLISSKVFCTLVDKEIVVMLTTSKVFLLENPYIGFDCYCFLRL